MIETQEKATRRGPKRKFKGQVKRSAWYGPKAVYERLCDIGDGNFSEGVRKVEEFYQQHADGEAVPA